MKIILFAVTALVMSCSLLTSRAQAADESTFGRITGKKLLEYTWGPPRPEFVMEHIKEMEKRPFEGTIMRPFFGSGQVFNIKNFRDHRELTSKQFDKYEPIYSEKLTDNFLGMYAQSNMDWFSDEDWKDIAEYVRLIAAGAKKLNCVGVMFDPEPYGSSPWIYNKQLHHGTKSYDEYAAKVQQRGREFMEAINVGFPGAKVLFLHNPYTGAYNVSHNPDAQIRNAALQKSEYALYTPFSLGMLEVCQGNNRLIETTQGAYYNSSVSEYYQQYWTAVNPAKMFIPKDLHKQYSAYSRVASTMYADAVMAGNRGILSVHSATARQLTPEQRLQWLEYNTYQSLRTADEYVWFYGEQVNWWKDSDAALNPLRDQMTTAILAAKGKLMKGEDIGFEVKDFVAEAKQKAEELKHSAAAKIKPQSATIQKITSPLNIDGKLSEKAYAEIPWLSSFVNFAETGGTPTISTQAWAAYDDNNLYLAFRCPEKDMVKQIVKDDSVWLGESVDISLLKPGELANDPYATYFHLIVNPRNVRYNSIDKGTQSVDQPFKISWLSGTSKDTSGWYAEIALPWKEMGFSNVAKGMVVHINFARQRNASVTEFTSWSQNANKFQEPQNFGTITLQ